MNRCHRAQDEQSLRLTQAAVAALQERPSLVREVLATLDHWDAVAPADSRPLRERWRHILHTQDWPQALDPGPAGQQLRQASPLGKALSAQQRLAIIRACRESTSSI